MISIALRYGFRDWRRIWDCPENGELRHSRPNPHVLYEGDTVFVPDPAPRVETCATEETHRFVLRKLRAHFRVLLDDEGVPFEGHRYRLEVGGETFEGTTGPRGLVEHEIDPHATEARLELWLDRDAPSDDHVHVWTLDLGHLDPPETITGAQGALQNLGYYDGEVNGQLDDATREALIEFQRDLRLPEPHGTLDEPTRAALRRAHER